MRLIYKIKSKFIPGRDQLPGINFRQIRHNRFPDCDLMIAPDIRFLIGGNMPERYVGLMLSNAIRLQV